MFLSHGNSVRLNFIGFLNLIEKMPVGVDLNLHCLNTSNTLLASLPVT